MLTPALLGAWIIFFIYALGALSVPLLIGKPAGIYLFSIEIYLAATQFPTDLNIASAYSLFFLAVSFLGIVLYRRLTQDIDQFATIRGRAFRPRRFKLGAARPLAELEVATLLTVVVLLPFLVLLWNALMPFPQAPSAASLSMISFENSGQRGTTGRPNVRFATASSWASSPASSPLRLRSPWRGATCASAASAGRSS